MNIKVLGKRVIGCCLEHSLEICKYHLRGRFGGGVARHAYPALGDQLLGMLPGPRQATPDQLGIEPPSGHSRYAWLSGSARTPASRRWMSA